MSVIDYVFKEKETRRKEKKEIVVFFFFFFFTQIHSTHRTKPHSSLLFSLSFIYILYYHYFIIKKKANHIYKENHNVNMVLEPQKLDLPY